LLATGRPYRFVLVATCRFFPAAERGWRRRCCDFRAVARVARLLDDFVERFPAFFELEPTARALTFTRRCAFFFGLGVGFAVPTSTQPPEVRGRGLTNVTLFVPEFRLGLRTSKPLAIGRPASAV
jgi:hypothetical protein